MPDLDALDPTSWRKSSASIETECIEVACGSRQVLVRDSKNANGLLLAFPHHAWSIFLRHLPGR
jgi:hypothetical protein